MIIDIRKAELSDVDEIALIETKADYYKFHGGNADIAQADNFRTKSYRKLISEGSDVFVLLADGVISAVCAFISRKEAEFSGYADIIALCVLPGMQHKGLARRLLLYVLDIMRENGYKGAYVRLLDCLDDPHEQGIFRFFEDIGFMRRDSAPDRDNIYEITLTIRF